MTSKVESEYVIGREHPRYGEDFKEEDYLVQGEVRCGVVWGSGWVGSVNG